MNPLRLLGRIRGDDPAEEDRWRAGTGPTVWASVDPAGWPPVTDTGRPVLSPTADPPTDPHGWPPVPDLDRPAPTPGWTPADLAEAAGLATAFALDYLSWDEADAARRGEVLRGYLRDPGDDPARLGWSGRGRQRAELAVPGRICPDPRGRLLVDVRVRVTPYATLISTTPPVGPDRATAPASDPWTGSVPAVAPPPAGRGWRGLASRWVRLWVPVVCLPDRMMIDTWDRPGGPAAVPPVESIDDPLFAAPSDLV